MSCELRDKLDRMSALDAKDHNRRIADGIFYHGEYRKKGRLRDSRFKLHRKAICNSLILDDVEILIQLGIIRNQGDLNQLMTGEHYSNYDCKDFEQIRIRLAKKLREGNKVMGHKVYVTDRRGRETMSLMIDGQPDPELLDQFSNYCRSHGITFFDVF